MIWMWMIRNIRLILTIWFNLLNSRMCFNRSIRHSNSHRKYNWINMNSKIYNRVNHSVLKRTIIISIRKCWDLFLIMLMDIEMDMIDTSRLFVSRSIQTRYRNWKRSISMFMIMSMKTMLIFLEGWFMNSIKRHRNWIHKVIRIIIWQIGRQT